MTEPDPALTAELADLERQLEAVPWQEANDTTAALADRIDVLRRGIHGKCWSCVQGEHSECEEPQKTRMERDTGYHHVVLCCCQEDDYDGDGPEDDEEPTTLANRFDVW